jgi:hypothetical protein
MRKLFVLFTILLLLSSLAFGATFAPTPMKLDGDAQLSYQFDGSNLTIPVRLSGTPALVKYAIFTKDKGDTVSKVRNGYLGWHYMDKIDTCIYVSADYTFQPGNHTVTWNGMDQDGGTVAKDTYTYYLWGYDNVSAPLLAIPDNQGYATNDEYLVWDPEGNRLPKPIWYCQQGGARREMRWVLGGDPEDEALMETCYLPVPEGWRDSDYGHWLVDSQNFGIVYGRTFNSTTVVGRARKYNWVPNDTGTEDSVFGVEFTPLNNYSGSEYDDTYLFYGECNYKETVPRTYLHIIDYRNTDTGEYIGYIDQSLVFEGVDQYEQYKENTQASVLMNGGWTQSSWFAEEGWMIGGNHCCCLRVACEPTQYFDDPDSDCIRWENGNGDMVTWDINFETTSIKPWVCNSLGVNISAHGFGCDKHGIVQTGEYWGAVSMQVATPDGTGFGKFSYAGEMDVHKGGFTVLDWDTPYDGCYHCKPKADGTGIEGLTYWNGHDSFRGIISHQVSVEADAPAAFSVAQNTPNPFNPSTTISFTLAKSGNVTVDVFNVAGQKIASLVDGYREAGAHSVMWDASGQAAGVYFYTVKAGDMSSTMKMTLLK